MPFWNTKCADAVEAREEARHIANNSNNDEDKFEFRRQRGLAQRTIKDAGRDYWRNYCSTIKENTKLGSVWRMARRMNGTQVNPSIPLLVQNGRITRTIQQYEN